jgi:hypothetical protein
MYKGYLHEDAIPGALVEILATRVAHDVRASSDVQRNIDVQKVADTESAGANSIFSFRWLKFEVVVVVHPRGARSR